LVGAAHHTFSGINRSTGYSRNCNLLKSLNGCREI
jgi:hypothetical protein